jgi:hypothetical protein
MKLQVSVKQHHIQRGRPHDCHDCPIGLAIRESLSKVVQCDVRGNVIHLYLADGRMFTSLTPHAVRDFAATFDHADALGARSNAKPFDFELEVFDWVYREN